MMIALAVSESHARELIAKLVKECSAGVSDREDEALKIADKWTLDESWVRDDFAEARDLAKRRKAELEAASKELGVRGREIAKR
jgi:LmbE family N-acetylglucosaminyl deacetylase